MGMQQRLDGQGGLTWEAIRSRLAGGGFTFAMRMIDNLPAFPDETPEDGWRDVRIATGNGMITLRRSGADLEVVSWGNAEAGLKGDVDRLVELLRAEP
jgi:hypothetical protein